MKELEEEWAVTDCEAGEGEATRKPSGFFEKLNLIPPLDEVEQLIIVP